MWTIGVEDCKECRELATLETSATGNRKVRRGREAPETERDVPVLIYNESESADGVR